MKTFIAALLTSLVILSAMGTAEADQSSNHQKVLYWRFQCYMQCNRESDRCMIGSDSKEDCARYRFRCKTECDAQFSGE